MRSLTVINLALGLLTGCAAYQVGSDSLYAPDIATVYVPMIESDSYRRDLGERLTEAVIKEIELKTPYKVVGTPDADSILSVKLLGDTRTLLAEDSFDDPRLSESTVYSEVSWLNRRRSADRADADDRRCRRSWSASTRRPCWCRKPASRSPPRSSRPSSGWPSRSSARWKRRGRFPPPGRRAVCWSVMAAADRPHPPSVQFGDCARGRSNCRGGRC